MRNQDEVWLLKEKYNGEETAEFMADCARLAAGEPLGYVIGNVPFLGCTIWLDNCPLIPRIETEFWVEKVIVTVDAQMPGTQQVLAQSIFAADASLQASVRQPVRILDLCAGSGAIGVAVARHVPEAIVDFAEIDDRLLPTIEKNIAVNEIDTKRCRVLQSDLFSSISHKESQTQSPESTVAELGGFGWDSPHGDKSEFMSVTSRNSIHNTYDFILTNPPYIDPALDRTQTSVKNYEPHLALYGGAEGMELIAKIVTAAPTYLAPHGQLWIEHEPEQAKIIDTLANTAGFQSCIACPDQFNIIRYSILKM